MVFMYVLAFYWVIMLVWMTYFAVVKQRDPVGGMGGGGGGSGGGGVDNGGDAVGGDAVGGGNGNGSGDDGTTTATGGGVEESAGCSVPSAAHSSPTAGDSGRESYDEDVVCGTSSDHENAGAAATYTFMHEGQSTPDAGADGLFQRKGVAEAGVAE